MVQAKFATEGPDQETIVRDGFSVLVSKKNNSIVMLRAAKRESGAGSRPMYVLAMFNPSTKPINFTFSNLTVVQMKDGQPHKTLHALTYEELLQEERIGQVWGIALAAASAGANSYAASKQGYYNSTVRVSGPNGASTFRVTGFSPTANAIAQARATEQNQILLNNVINQGQQNLAALERSALKDNTILTGEWYGGLLIFERPDIDGDRAFRISVDLGKDHHDLTTSLENRQ